MSKDQRDKVDAHLCVSQYAGHGKKQRYLSSELYTLFWQFNYPEHCMHLQSGLTQRRPRVTPNSGSVMITLEQSLTMALVCQHQMYVADVYYLMLKTMLKNTVTLSCWPSKP